MSLPPDTPSRILVVCLGNQCRSPLAERLLSTRLEQLGVGDVEVASAGTLGPEGVPMDADAAAQLERLGGTADGFVSRRLSADVLTSYDLVLTATRQLRTDVVRMSPRLMKRCFVLTELAQIVERGALTAMTVPQLRDAATSLRSMGAAAPDVPDPMGRPLEIHQQAADQIEAAVAVVAAALAR